MWIALVERRAAWAGVRGSADSASSLAAAAAEAEAALEAAAVGGVAAHVDGLAALLAVAGAPDEHAVQASLRARVEAFRVYASHEQDIVFWLCSHAIIGVVLFTSAAAQTMAPGNIFYLTSY